MAIPLLRASCITRYALYALILGLVATVCAEKVFEKDIGLLTSQEIEENLQVRISMSILPKKCV